MLPGRVVFGEIAREDAGSGVLHFPGALMRICSLLPSATEILFALGLNEAVAVTHECDYPAQARTKPGVTTSVVQ